MEEEEAARSTQNMENYIEDRNSSKNKKPIEREPTSDEEEETEAEEDKDGSKEHSEYKNQQPGSLDRQLEKAMAEEGNVPTKPRTETATEGTTGEKKDPRNNTETTRTSDRRSRSTGKRRGRKPREGKRTEKQQKTKRNIDEADNNKRRRSEKKTHRRRKSRIDRNKHTKTMRKKDRGGC